ncbi:isocitrate/isopropylmalate dehydrogenase family protein [Pelagibius marinus]|uniref:isocitrate/isopropylmalate dehydrogenase family protein n=1 Tax=Pelagibius marinus TaxID=2762760 RepID=UPI001872CAB0|nr:isocitrate/isopropylmalate family dehydrogenase [Pelagibius marinus]
MKFLVMAGDGIGEEITEATLKVLEAADGRFGLGLDFEAAEIGLKALAKHGTTMPDGVLERARASDGIILGPISHLDYPAPEEGGVNISGVVRSKLDLYANVRPARTRPGLPAKGGDFDLVIMREATEGFYPDRNMFAGRAEFMTDPDTALSIRKISRKASARIARRSYELAMKRRKKVTLIHKANTFRLSDGLFLEACHAVAKEFPEVETDEVIVDAMAALLVRHPERYDVICATNFHADILSDLASELSGSLGLAGSVNAGDDLCCAQAQHGSAPDIAGQDRANPSSLILSAAMLLDWIADKRGLAPCGAAARAIDGAVDAALARPETRTPDLGGALGTRAFAEHIAAAVAA